MPFWSSNRSSWNSALGAAVLMILVLGMPLGAKAGAAPVIAPQATLTIQPDHGSCDRAVTFAGNGFVPGSTVVLRPLHAASGDPYPNDTAFEVAANDSGSFTVTASPCPRGVSTTGQVVVWLAEPPGRPYFVTDGPFGAATFTVFDLNSSRYFQETGHSITGEFLYTWEYSGGLPVFGFPLTDALVEQNPDTGADVSVQYFERQRFELHPEYAGSPYLVLLGRLGDQILRAQGRNWPTEAKADPATPYYFPETGHAIAPEFWTYWSTNGLELGDTDVSFRESLALFGYPLTEPAIVTNSDGDTVLTQFFERAAFEWHPQNPDEVDPVSWTG